MKALTKSLLIAAVLGTVSVLSAAPAVTPAPADASDVPKPIVLTDAEMKANAATMTAQMSDDARHVMHLKDVAKKQKDVIKHGCVNDRLVQLKAEMNIADGVNQQLQTSIASGADDRQTVYGTLVEHSTSVKRLREEANGCAGEPELSKNDVGVEVSHPMFPDDPTIVHPTEPTGGGNEIEPPAYASPFH